MNRPLKILFYILMNLPLIAWALMAETQAELVIIIGIIIIANTLYGRMGIE